MIDNSNITADDGHSEGGHALLGDAAATTTFSLTRVSGRDLPRPAGDSAPQHAASARARSRTAQYRALFRQACACRACTARPLLFGLRLKTKRRRYRVHSARCVRVRVPLRSRNSSGSHQLLYRLDARRLFLLLLFIFFFCITRVFYSFRLHYQSFF